MHDRWRTRCSTQRSSLASLLACLQARLVRKQTAAGRSTQVEKLGLLSKAEAAGFTLSKIEQAGLLSLAEESGVLSLVASP